MNQEIDIRRADTGDTTLIARLSAITFYDTFIDTCTADDMRQFIEESYNENLIARELSDENDYYFIAFVNGEATGYLRLKEDNSDIPLVNQHASIELKRLYVLKEFKGKKVGPALMNFALRWANEREYELMWLGVWEHNERAKAFYKKNGFVETGFSHPFPIGNTPQTDIWLYKML